MDTNCDGGVDWDEYLSYMLLEYREKDAMRSMIQSKPLPKEMRTVPNMTRYQRHHDTIIRLRLQPNITKHTNNLYSICTDAGGKYISVSKDGIINFWTVNLKHIRKHKLPPPKSSRKNIGLWVTDLVCAPNLNMIAVASTSGTIVFYDLTAYSFRPVLTLADLEICVTCMEFWVDPALPSRAKIIWGDARGNVSVLMFDDCPSICFLQPTINKQFKERVEFSELMKQTTCGVRAFKFPRIHEDLVIEIKYFHNLNECFVSCCRGKETSLFMGDLSRRKASYFAVSKGVQTFDYSTRHNVLITGGRDSLIRVWHPYASSKPVMTLQGTKSAILFVFVHEKNEHIYSVSQDKEIHVFDMNTQSCIQTIFRKWVPMGPRHINAAVFNSTRKALVLANNRLAMFEHQEHDLFSQQLVSHNTRVNHVLYNDLFHQVVSCGVDSLVVVWDAENGERIIQFQAHKIPQIGGGDIELEITAMRFDPSQRRLITAARDGKIKLWNHNNGALLREIKVADTHEITGIICPKQRIMTAGWNRRITVYVDSYTDETLSYWQHKHREDITTLCFKKPSYVASGSYDGDILVWTLETGHVTLRFNAHLSSKPVSILKRLESSYDDLLNEHLSTSEQKMSTDDLVSEDEDEKLLREFMAYNTQRASIAAQIPFMSRRQSKAHKSERKSNTVAFARLPTISTLQSSDLIGLKMVSEEDEELNADSSSHISLAATTVTQSTYPKSSLLHSSPLSSVTFTGNMDENFNNSNINHITDAKYKYDKYLCRNESSILKLIFLDNRDSDKETATLVSASSGGWIRFWAVEHTGGLKGQFNAAHRVGETVQTICVDSDNDYLFTGDSEGYIKVWDISEYCLNPKKIKYVDPIEKKYKYEKFPLLLEEHSKLISKLKKQSRHRPPPTCTDPDKSWFAPMLINSFKGHLQGISEMAYIDACERLVTCASDCSVRMWSIYGQFIGIFGQETPWTPMLKFQSVSTKTRNKMKRQLQRRRGNLQEELVDAKIVVRRKMPADIRSVASATTLRVFNAGIRPKWKLLRNIFMIWLPLLKEVRNKRKQKTKRLSQVYVTPIVEPVKIDKPPQTKIHKLSTSELDLTSVKEKLKKFEETQITSDVLGMSYKSPMKHKPLPKIVKPRQFQTQVSLIIFLFNY